MPLLGVFWRGQNARLVSEFRRYVRGPPATGVLGTGIEHVCELGIGIT